ncbi:large conductance mechanosensitive channel protein MscL [Halalkalibacillus sediminis]|uniref:Large-conductance mechanosensitive channel n=1 Tax=Halalkalibacillus sediminis TaxID=2018042 RepID=A0A2I0QTC2_9BACI|nr:large conductance mechanosensitive channel protein MscL [Halalkalibacillus sediminis]PKR77576.1 large conductance mechanosensitive channel protein MscL [Halalkalibacillus sediminis]
MWNEFKKFALRGNVFEVAIAVVIGTAFSKIVDSLVNDIIMPIFGVLVGGTSIKFLVLNIDGVIIRYGSFFQTAVDFFVITFSIYLFIKLFNYLRGSESVPLQETPHPNREVLTEIRDILKEDQLSSKEKSTDEERTFKVRIK